MKIKKWGFNWFVFPESRKTDHLPDGEGLYMVGIKNTLTNKLEIIYIGSTVSFRRRVAAHEVRAAVRKTITNSEILLFLFSPLTENRIKKEGQLIRDYKPKFNRHFTYRGKELKNPVQIALDGRFDSWAIDKMRRLGFRMDATEFSKKKKLNNFNEKELKALSEILGTTIEG